MVVQNTVVQRTMNGLSGIFERAWVSVSRNREIHPAEPSLLPTPHAHGGRAAPVTLKDVNFWLYEVLDLIPGLLPELGSKPPLLIFNGDQDAGTCLLMNLISCGRHVSDHICVIRQHLPQAKVHCWNGCLACPFLLRTRLCAHGWP